MSTRTGFDLEGLRLAIENLDARYQLALYASDAEVEIIDSEHRGATPRRLCGKRAIGEWITMITSEGGHAHVVAAESRPDRIAMLVDYQDQDQGRSPQRYEWAAEVTRGQISKGTITVGHSLS
jgi:hypothetical protein